MIIGSISTPNFAQNEFEKLPPKNTRKPTKKLAQKRHNWAPQLSPKTIQKRPSTTAPKLSQNRTKIEPKLSQNRAKNLPQKRAKNLPQSDAEISPKTIQNLLPKSAIGFSASQWGFSLAAQVPLSLSQPSQPPLIAIPHNRAAIRSRRIAGPGPLGRVWLVLGLNLSLGSWLVLTRSKRLLRQTFDTKPPETDTKPPETGTYFSVRVRDLKVFRLGSPGLKI